MARVGSPGSERDAEDRRFYEADAARPPSRRRWSTLPLPVAAWLELPWRDRWRWLKRKLYELVARPERLESPDRTILEERLLTAYARDPALRLLLFVGCEWYTKGYESLFEPDGARFRTIDHDPRKARHGSAGHIVAALQDAHLHLAPSSVDAIVCNGVLGFGINDRAELARAFAASFTVLRAGGSLLFGWNDVPALAPFDPSEVALASGFASDVQRAEPWRIRTDTPTRHTFDLYLKPSSPSG